MLPSMLLQPIVENAIKFGLYDTTEEVTVSIRAEMEGNYLIIMVQNPYDPQTSRPRQRHRFWPARRTAQAYICYLPVTDLMETHANDNIFTTIIKIPQV